MKRSPFPRSGRPTEGDRVGGGEDRRKALFSMTGSKMRWRMNWWSIIALKEGESRDRRWWMYRRKKERAEEREEERMEGEERRVLGLCYSRRSKEVENERMTYAHNGWETRDRRWRMSLRRKKQGKLQKRRKNRRWRMRCYFALFNWKRREEVENERMTYAYDLWETSDRRCRMTLKKKNYREKKERKVKNDVSAPSVT